MSVAGILASSLFSHAGSYIAQKAGLGSGSKSGNISTSTQPSFAAIQQKLEALSGSSTNNSSLAGQITQLGSDLKTGNISAAQNDFNSMQTTLGHSTVAKLHHQYGQATSADGSSLPSATQMAAALQAYSSLQQNPLNVAANGTLMANPGTLSVTV
jgi:hypothetical protein